MMPCGEALLVLGKYSLEYALTYPNHALATVCTNVFIVHALKSLLHALRHSVRYALSMNYIVIIKTLRYLLGHARRV